MVLQLDLDWLLRLKMNEVKFSEKTSSGRTIDIKEYICSLARPESLVLVE